MAYKDYIHIKLKNNYNFVAESWCEENFGEKAPYYNGDWDRNTRWMSFYGGYFSFRREEDALAFKLRWC